MIKQLSTAAWADPAAASGHTGCPACEHMIKHDSTADHSCLSRSCSCTWSHRLSTPVITWYNLIKQLTTASRPNHTAAPGYIGCISQREAKGTLISNGGREGRGGGAWSILRGKLQRACHTVWLGRCCSAHLRAAVNSSSGDILLYVITQITHCRAGSAL